ncbi:CKLF-like MARVEL transmembrane domain-containing protein 8 [Acipenser ruthenus]|uniref:CKLF-like MARVEL transmembrane domain-containing protein 8 n=1 Tax=Acipenser ruthenus TaxID=7906 RepID=A0A662YX44_ACIRT|nr:CKLF-like MARVEL transmembrane domain-containing protein 8 [Acipenser ruthenus]
MDDCPRSHTVTTTTSSSYSEEFVSSALEYDKDFIKTIPGILIFLEIILGLLVWTLIAGTEYFRVSAFGWVMFVAVFYWVLTVFFLILYLTMAYTRIPQVPWTTVVVLLIAFLCVHCAAWTDYSAYRYFEVVTVWFLITFLIFYIMYVFRLQKKIPCINWPLTEFLHYAIGTLLIFIASIVAAVNSRGYAGLVAGSVFGFFATVLLAMSIWMSYKITCGSQPTS